MSTGNVFGLSDTDVKVALCALKAMLMDGKIEKGRLASLTGHANPDSANRVWYMAKNKLMKTDASPSGSATSLVDVDTPTKGPKKTPAKMRGQTSKKRAKTQAAEDDSDEEMDKKPAKRAKKKPAEDTSVNMADEV